MTTKQQMSQFENLLKIVNDFDKFIVSGKLSALY